MRQEPTSSSPFPGFIYVVFDIAATRLLVGRSSRMPARHRDSLTGRDKATGKIPKAGTLIAEVDDVVLAERGLLHAAQMVFGRPVSGQKRFLLPADARDREPLRHQFETRFVDMVHRLGGRLA